MITINQKFKSEQEYTFSISQVPEISTDTAYIYSIQDTNNNLTARKINNTVFGLTYSGSSETFTSNIQLVINGVSGYDNGLTVNFTVNGTLAKEPVRIYNTSNYTVSVDIYRNSSSAPTLDIYYCVGSREGSYTHYTNSTDSGYNPIKSISVGPNQSVWIYSDTMTRWSNSNYEYDYIRIGTPNYSGVKLELSGNIMSLVTGNDFQFAKLFQNFQTLSSVSNNFLPATTLTTACYRYMFNGCSSLTTAPNLPATTLAYNCYADMFRSCTALTTAPTILPATTLAEGCYSNMFYICRALTTAPELPATTLVSNCYYHMLYGCSSLNYIKALFTTTPSDSYTNLWVNGVASTGTFVKNHNATWDVTGTNAIPSGWTVITDTYNDDNGME